MGRKKLLLSGPGLIARNYVIYDQAGRQAKTDHGSTRYKHLWHAHKTQQKGRHENCRSFHTQHNTHRKKGEEGRQGK